MLPDITDRFDKVRNLGSGRYMVCCPVHSDRTPSLSLTRTEESWLLNCFAGCETEDILAAVGLGWKDICPERPEWAAAKMQKRNLPPIDELDVDRLVLQQARNALVLGEKLSFEDEARTKLAIERLEASYD